MRVVGWVPVPKARPGSSCRLTAFGSGAACQLGLEVEATTGRVRLASDSVGLLLQIVPTLTDVAPYSGGGYEGATYVLSGSGFTEGVISVW